MDGLAIWDGDLEIRRRGGGRYLSGSFRYNRTATVRDRGRVRKERVRSRAFGWQIRRFQELQEEMSAALGEILENRQRPVPEIEEELQRRNIHVLVGHSFDRPLGDMLSGTARITDDDEAISFEIDLPPEDEQPTYMKDVLAMIRSSRAGGISPGFRVPPRDVVPNAEHLEPEPGNPGVQIRVINQAVLYELSIVTRPAYAGTEIDLRTEDFAGIVPPEEPYRRPSWQ